MQTLITADLLRKKFIGVDDLRRQLTDILKTLPKEGGKLVITQHGKPQAILIDLDTYLKIQELEDTLADYNPKLIKKINKAVVDARKGNVVDADEVFKNLGI